LLQAGFPFPLKEGVSEKKRVSRALPPLPPFLRVSKVLVQFLSEFKGNIAAAHKPVPPCFKGVGPVLKRIQGQHTCRSQTTFSAPQASKQYLINLQFILPAPPVLL
jgi:hypothetical protein